MRKYLDLKLGYDCNNNCKHCVIADQRINSRKLHNKENRTFDEIKQTILEAKQKGITSITITGGEPTLRSDFKQIVEFCKENNLYVLLQSNGRLFSNQNFLNQVKDYIDMYMIALHGSTKEIHDKIVQVKGFDQVIKGLKNLEGKKVGIKVVISNYNKDDLVNILKLVNELNIKYVNIAFPHANGNALTYFDEIIPRYEELKQELFDCIKYSQKEDLLLDFEAILPCLFEETLSPKYFSDLKFHKSQGIVNQLDEGEFEWNDARKNSKRKCLKCKTCIYDRFCEGYWKEYIDRFGFEEFNSVKRFPKEFIEIMGKFRK